MKQKFLMMKKTLLFAFSLFFVGFVSAQSIDEAKQLEYNERYNSAKAVLHQLLQKEPANAEAWYLLSQAYLHNNETDKIQDTLLLAPNDVKNDPYYQVAYGQALLQKNQTDSANLYFNNALDKTKRKNADILKAVAKAQIDEKAGDANYAIELINKAIKRDKKNAALYTTLGNAYRKLNNGTEAYKAYQQALEKDSKYAEARYQLGKIFVTQKNAEMYLKFFNQLLAEDANYAPVYYDLYYHYYFRDPKQAMDYFNKYVALSDYDPKNEYAHTDLLYLTKQYDAAISNAKKLIEKGANDAEPRLNKLIAYSYQGLKDTATALPYMQKYFATVADSNIVQKDYEGMADIYASLDGKKDSAGIYYQKALAMEKDSTAMIAYYQKLADLYKSIGDYSSQAVWLGKYNHYNPQSTNLDLFNLGLTHFRAKEYNLSDSVFTLYTEKYPEQTYGYYWRARSNAALDSGMVNGLAIPHYEQLIPMLEKDTTNETNKKWLIEAYGYIAAYKTNIEKDYATAIDYFEKLLVLDPENADVQRYIGILKQNLSKNDTTQAKG